MSFLNPSAMFIAAAVTVPALLALYFLKLKRVVHYVPSTLLWKRTVEDLRVNAPFQRLRSSLLLFLQLLILLLGAVALGRPMFKTTESYQQTLMILIDQSASMNVIEADGRSRLQQAKELAKRCVDNMGDAARAMVISFCDRPTVVSAFDTDKGALKKKIDAIQRSESTSNLAEAISLAEAYAHNVSTAAGDSETDETRGAKWAAVSVFVFSDGRIENPEDQPLDSFDLSKVAVTTVGTRGDNVGIIGMDARRNRDRPEILEVVATVQNFGPKPVTLDATLYLEGRNVDVQTLTLGGARGFGEEPRGLGAAGREVRESADADSKMVAFDDVEFGNAGLVEAVLQVQDALPSDDHAWTIIDEPRRARVLLVTEGNIILSNLLTSLPIELVTMTPAEYEGAADSAIQKGGRSTFDVVMLDSHSTARLPKGNYFFWGSVPQVEGVATGRSIQDEAIVNWDENHPLLRHVAIETLFVYEWLELTLPKEAEAIIEGETSPVLSYFTRGPNRYLVSAFPLTVQDPSGKSLLNTYWVTTVDFVVFVQNAVEFLASNLAMRGANGIHPGESVTLQLPTRATDAHVVRPDGTRDLVTPMNSSVVHYEQTRSVGPYRIIPGVTGEDRFAVNLFNPVESRVKPPPSLKVGAQVVEARTETIQSNRPAWGILLLAMIAFVLLEWVVYNRRVFV